MSKNNKTFIKQLYDSIVEFESYNKISTNNRRIKYNEIKRKINNNNTSVAKDILNDLETLGDYLDCKQMIENIRIDSLKLDKFYYYINLYETKKYFEAYNGFISLDDYLESKNFALKCEEHLQLIYAANNLPISKIKASNISLLIKNLELIKGYLDTENLISYYQAIKLFLEKDYLGAKEAFEKNLGYKNSISYVQKCTNTIEDIYNECCSLKIEEIDSKSIIKALEKLKLVSAYKNVQEIIDKFNHQLSITTSIEKANKLYDEGKFEELLNFTKNSENPKMLKIRQDVLNFSKAQEYYQNQKYDEAIEIINSIPKSNCVNFWTFSEILNDKLAKYNQNIFDPKTKTDQQLRNSINVLNEIKEYKDVKKVINLYLKELNSTRRKMMNSLKKISSKVMDNWKAAISIISIAIILIIFISARIKVANDKKRNESVHNVTYVLNGGKGEYLYDDYVTQYGLYLSASKMSKPYHTFEGWYFDAEFTQPIFDSPYWKDGTYFVDSTSDYTLYAKWEPRVYNIKYQFYDKVSGEFMDDVNHSNPKEVTYKDVHSKIIVPEIEGYKFIGTNYSYDTIGSYLSENSNKSQNVRFNYFKIPDDSLEIASKDDVNFDNYEKGDLVKSYEFIPTKTNQYEFYVKGYLVGRYYCNIKIYDDKFELVSTEKESVYSLEKGHKYYVCLYYNKLTNSTLTGVNSFFVVPSSLDSDTLKMISDGKISEYEVKKNQRYSVDVDSRTHYIHGELVKVDVENMEYLIFNFDDSTSPLSTYEIEIFDENFKKLVDVFEYFKNASNDGVIVKLDIADCDCIYLWFEVKNYSYSTIDFGFTLK